jgi:glycosyltransferase involved in cell wall biosynthesis
MRLLLVSFFYEHDHGGAEMVAREARRLMTEKLGWEIDVLCLAGGPDRGAGIHRIEPPAWCPGGQWFKRAVLFLANRQLDRWFLRAVQRARVRPKNYDAIFCPDMNAIVLARQLAEAADKPLFTWCQEVVPKRIDEQSTRTLLAPMMNRWLTARDKPWREALAASRRVASVSDFITRRTRKYVGASQGSGQFVTLYPPLEEYFVKAQRPPVRTEADARVLFYGRLSTEKGIDLLLRAWRKLNLPATLSILGMDGPLRAEVEDIAAARDDITLLDPVPHAEVPALIAAHDIVCCPSRVEESLCRTVLEARWLERTIVTTQSGAIPEVIRDYPLAHSINVRTDDLEAANHLAKALQNAIQSPRAFKAPQRAAESDFRKRFLPETFVVGIRALFDD